MRNLSFLLLLFGLAPQAAPSVTIKIQDMTGAPLGNQLVIVQRLPGEEVLRALSDRNGDVPLPNLQRGIYRVISTNPYGLWETQVREFLVTDKPITVYLPIPPTPTHGNGDVVTIGDRSTDLQVIGADGQPAPGATILVRDDKDTLYLERWYKTDGKGIAKIELVANPTVVVVVYGDKLVMTRVSNVVSNPVVRIPQSP